ncbi:hypothetical protein GQ607_001341 [Colletotrichum asianum]|uniref:Uncharacterized protein n=1 Tax=Colletotrichum asianum TaxID=702518 RepID=A0A8H3WRI6_9PEZI|nr:hypothetical protein GQ607_001341 [Colletotrichum asianum]
MVQGLPEAWEEEVVVVEEPAGGEKGATGVCIWSRGQRGHFRGW